MADPKPFEFDSEYSGPAQQTKDEMLIELQEKIHQHLVADTDLQQLQNMSRKQLMERIGSVTAECAREPKYTLTAGMRQEVISDVFNEVRGFGPLQELLEDETITEIMVNGPETVFVEREGKVEPADVTFRSEDHLMRIIAKITAPLGRRLDEAQPMVDARLPDGSRVNAIIPPVSLSGPCVTIRKFSADPFTTDDLIDFGTFTGEMCEFLRACVQARLNIMVSGGTGSGKTTTLNVLSSMLPEDDRIVTIEDAAELQLQKEHVVTLESRPPNLEGEGEITIRQLLRNALRMRPDRIIVGEVRGGEALDMLQAMNTGHDGSLTTADANSPRDTLSRLETMVLMAGTELPSQAIREQIAAALHLLVQQSRMQDGTRKITHITEVQAMEGEHIVTQDLYKFEETGMDASGTVHGEHQFTGLRPLFAERLLKRSTDLPDEFQKAWNVG